MKTLLSLITLILVTSCASIDSAVVMESDTGRLYPASHLDGLRGMASGKRDAEQMRFADAIIAGGGTVKVLRWDDGRKYTALRLVKCADGTEFWQGPPPPSGFYGSKLETEILTRAKKGQRCIIHYPHGDRSGIITDIIGTAHEVMLDNGKRENVFRFNPDEITLLP